MCSVWGFFSVSGVSFSGDPAQLNMTEIFHESKEQKKYPCKNQRYWSLDKDTPWTGWHSYGVLLILLVLGNAHISNLHWRSG